MKSLILYAKENHPGMPICDPQNEFPGIPWVGLSPGITTFLNMKPGNSRNFPAFPGESFGVLKSRFQGKMNLIMLGSGDP